MPPENTHTRNYKGAPLSLPQTAPPRPPRGLSVWKVPVQPLGRDQVSFKLPAPAEILSVGWERDRAVLWVRVAPDALRCERRILIAQTHREGLLEGRYVGTVHNPAGCAFHFFEIPVEGGQSQAVAVPALQMLDLAA